MQGAGQLVAAMLLEGDKERSGYKYIQVLWWPKPAFWIAMLHTTTKLVW